MSYTFIQIPHLLRRGAVESLPNEQLNVPIFQATKALLRFWTNENNMGRDKVKVFLAHHQQKGWGFMRYLHWYPESESGYTAEGSESQFLLLPELLEELKGTDQEPKLLMLMVQMPFQKIPKKTN